MMIATIARVDTATTPVAASSSAATATAAATVSVAVAKMHPVPYVCVRTLGLWKTFIIDSQHFRNKQQVANKIFFICDKLFKSRL